MYAQINPGDFSLSIAMVLYYAIAPAANIRKSFMSRCPRANTRVSSIYCVLAVKLAVRLCSTRLSEVSGSEPRRTQRIYDIS